jgi:16S rRNA (adenine1518-N6/adenine1519-N6)-dimethyltransferase
MNYVKAKKNLGQHFLKDLNIAKTIVESLSSDNEIVLEVGPGMGVLSEYLFQEKKYLTYLIEIDRESIDYLNMKYPENKDRIISGDFLKMNIDDFSRGRAISIIGNFPYNISSQIFFKVLENKDRVTEVVGMLQKEVAERIASGPGNKEYGILSVLLQAFYTVEYLFTVHEHVFSPPPKVKSAVIRVKRNNVSDLGCDEILFKKVIKTSFNQRRKMLRNSLKSICLINDLDHPFMEKRPEQLSVKDFVELTNILDSRQLFVKCS